MTQLSKHIKPDTKGRIYLGKLTEGVSGFAVTVDKHHRIILDPLVEIPAREKWLFDNKEALNSVQRGLKEAKGGNFNELGSFAEYLNDDEIE
ncbi:MAG: hypothetical protein A3H43_02475 [Gammaproteobacteria bacterium RIFCSPLOWO2_02_FULL_42_9]|nr:MAG: hypothetical protein A3H43_02475 [Gammaproteobacteria bacterium RIFCSPLOWO2_02_FULL_42_9]